MKITFLGTNGWYSTGAGDAVCTLVETEKCYFILDAGEGIRRADEFVTKDLPVYLFLTHLHFDHIFGLHILPRIPFYRQLKIVVPETQLEDLQRVLRSPFTASFSGEIIPVGTGMIEGLPFSCECGKLEHKDGAFGYRIGVDGKELAYCLDTAYCKGSVALAGGSDVLIHECTNRPGEQDSGWGHSNPEEAAQVAKEAGVKKLILTHFMPDSYPDQLSREDARDAARKIFTDTIAAMDGETVEI